MSPHNLHNINFVFMHSWHRHNILPSFTIIGVLVAWYMYCPSLSLKFFLSLFPPNIYAYTSIFIMRIYRDRETFFQWISCKRFVLFKIYIPIYRDFYKIYLTDLQRKLVMICFFLALWRVIHKFTSNLWQPNPPLKNGYTIFFLKIFMARPTHHIFKCLTRRLINLFFFNIENEKFIKNSNKIENTSDNRRHQQKPKSRQRRYKTMASQKQTTQPIRDQDRTLRRQNQHITH